MVRKCSKSLILALLVKVSFLYMDDRKVFLVPEHSPEHSPELRPTYQVKIQVYPEISKPILTVGLSRITKSSEVKPYVVTTVLQ